VKDFENFKSYVLKNHGSDMAIDAYQAVKKAFEQEEHVPSPEIQSLLITVSKALVEVNLRSTFSILEAYHRWKENA
jgi:tyrosyl-tRNA synthetase